MCSEKRGHPTFLRAGRDTAAPATNSTFMGGAPYEKPETGDRHDHSRAGSARQATTAEPSVARPAFRFWRGRWHTCRSKKARNCRCPPADIILKLANFQPNVYKKTPARPVEGHASTR